MCTAEMSDSGTSNMASKSIFSYKKNNQKKLPVLE
jgi:hypothetical protein